MTEREKQFKQIAEENSKWLDDFSGGNNLDTRGLPLGNLEEIEKQPETSFHYDRFSQPSREFTEGSSNVLKHFLDNPDAESIYASGDATLIQDHQRDLATAVIEDFVAKTPAFHETEENWGILLERVAHDAGLELELEDADYGDIQLALYLRGVLTVPNLQKAFAKTWKAGQLEAQPNSLKPLDEKDTYMLQSLLYEGKVADAADAYFRARCANHEHYLQVSAEPFSEDHKTLVRDGSWFCFENSPISFFTQAGLQPWVRSPERVKAMKELIGNRPVTFPVLIAAWRVVAEQEKWGNIRTSAKKQDAPRQSAPPTYDTIDSMDDEDVEQMYKNVRSKIATMSDIEYAKTMNRNK